MAGNTSSQDFPTTAGSLQPVNRVSQSSIQTGFLISLTSSFQTAWTTYLGSYGRTELERLFVDQTGDWYVVGNGFVAGLPGGSTYQAYSTDPVTFAMFAIKVSRAGGLVFRSLLAGSAGVYDLSTAGELTATFQSALDAGRLIRLSPSGSLLLARGIPVWIRNPVFLDVDRDNRPLLAGAG